VLTYVLNPSIVGTVFSRAVVGGVHTFNINGKVESKFVMHALVFDLE
jgi:hypothetical protein